MWRGESLQRFPKEQMTIAENMSNLENNETRIMSREEKWERKRGADLLLNQIFSFLSLQRSFLTFSFPSLEYLDT